MLGALQALNFASKLIEVYGEFLVVKAVIVILEGKKLQDDDCQSENIRFWTMIKLSIIPCEFLDRRWGTASSSGAR